MAFTVTRNRIAPCAAKIETTYATDPTISGATDGFNTIDSEVAWNAQIDRTEFRNHGISFTRQKDIFGARVANINFTFMAQGSGTAGTAVQGQSAVYQAAGLTETVVAVTSVTYKPSTIAALKSSAVKIEHNGLTHTAFGVYGNLVIACAKAGDATRCTFSGLGLYQAPSIGSIASWAVGATGVNRAQPNLGIALTLNNGTDTWTTPTVDSYRIDCGNDIRRIPDANSATGLKALLFADRNPSAQVVFCLDLETSGAVIQADELYTNWTSSTTHNVSWVLGATAGNIGTFTASQAQLVNVQQSSGDGYRMITLDYKLQNSTNESDWQVAWT